MKKILRCLKYDFKMYPKMYGKPDFILKNEGIAIFCDGDYWHGFLYNEKKPMKKYWEEKIGRNIQRDKQVSRKLRSDGWSVLRFWEHDIEKRPDVCARRIARKISSR